MIRHHPDDALLMALAADRLARGPAVVTAAHVERCAHCRSRLRDLDAVGGALLADAEPAVLAPAVPVEDEEPGLVAPREGGLRDQLGREPVIEVGN